MSYNDNRQKKLEIWFFKDDLDKLDLLCEKHIIMSKAEFIRYGIHNFIKRNLSFELSGLWDEHHRKETYAFRMPKELYNLFKQVVIRSHLKVGFVIRRILRDELKAYRNSRSGNIIFNYDGNINYSNRKKQT